jgi:hypothetical protein
MINVCPVALKVYDIVLKLIINHVSENLDWDTA